MAETVDIGALPETVEYRPAGSAVERGPEETELKFLIPPAKMVVIVLPNGEGVDTLIGQLHGGVHIASVLP